jgi:PPOX class probable F420-dependent enzyme
MATVQGNLALLNDPVAQKLLQSAIPARLAYIWTDGSPRSIPIWFHWNGQQIVLATPPDAPKMKALRQNPRVALTIDDNEMPYKVLMIRGTATVEVVEGVVPEYAAAAVRYFGQEQGQAWLDQVGGLMSQMARVNIQPEWVGIIDFEQRFPSAVERAMARA